MPLFNWGALTIADCWEPLLHPTVRSLKFSPIPEIDCDNCRMVTEEIFNQSARCCNYIPSIPNFLVGQILEERPPGYHKIEAWIESGRGEPLFLDVPWALADEYRRAASNPMNALPCPLLENDQSCGIYAYRPYLCIGYHCRYQNQYEWFFWTSMASLLALHTAIAAQYVSEQLGIDREISVAAWRDIGYQSPWTPDHRFKDSFYKKLWQGQSNPSEFYRKAYHFILERKSTLRSEIGLFRKEQLIRILSAENKLTANQHDAILNEPETPTPSPPGSIVEEQLSKDIIVYGNHQLTVTKLESALLYYHQNLYPIDD